MSLKWKYETATVTFEFESLGQKANVEAQALVVSDDGKTWRRPTEDDFRELGWRSDGFLFHMPEGWPKPSGAPDL